VEGRTLFDDLDATLAALLDEELPVENVTISFAAPDDQFPPSGVTLPAIAFFLYDIRENRELRADRWERGARPDGMVTRTRAPVRVDCSYLITAWPSEGTAAAADEHRLLGEVMKVLLRHPRIPEEYLRGELRGQEPPVPSRFLAESQLHSLGEFWQAMGGKPKATLQYGVTVGLDIFAPVEVGPQVSESAVRLGLRPARS
jgi:Pvc16 N-terminal domain